MTKKDFDRKTRDNEQLNYLLERYGSLMTGNALWKTLGFQNSAAFRQAKTKERLGLRVFSIPNRRGTFAHTREVDRWLKNLTGEDYM